MLLLVGCLSHTTADAGYVLVAPLGAVIFYAAGRHPLAGIAAAFAGVSAGLSANLIPAPLDPLLQGFTQSASQIILPGRIVNRQLAVNTAPLMRSIVPLIFLLFLIPSIAYGLVAGTVRSSRDVIAGMTMAMGAMSRRFSRRSACQAR
jgi:p-aminobenzoyl-glutamate transporter AbgT